MKKPHLPRRPAPLAGVVAAALLLGGCANSLYFGTETSGGLKVTGTRSAPTQVGLSYQRSEIAILPKGSGGETPSVFGGSDHDYSMGGSVSLSQTFATGVAAEVATGGTASTDPGKNQGDRMLFTTGTTFGLNLGLGESAAQSPTLIVGYRRAEGVIMPLNDKATNANASYADISIVYDDKDAPAPDSGNPRETIVKERLPRQKGGVRIKQQFATGTAAVKLVSQTGTKEKLYKAAGIAFGSLPAEPDEVRSRLEKVTDPAAKNRLVQLAARIAREAGQTAPTSFDLVKAAFVNGIGAEGLKKFVQEAGNDLPSP